MKITLPEILAYKARRLVAWRDGEGLPSYTADEIAARWRALEAGERREWKAAALADKRERAT